MTNRDPHNASAILLKGTQYDRLPLYAQRELDRLSARLREAYSKLDAQPTGNTVVDPYAPTPLQIGDDPTVEYRPHDGVSYVVKFRPDGLEVSANGRINDKMQVLPRVSNMVTIRCAE